VVEACVSLRRRSPWKSVGADRDPEPAPHFLDQGAGRLAFLQAGGLGQARRDDEARAVLHQQVAHEAEPGLLARALTEQPRLRVGARGMALKTSMEPFLFALSMHANRNHALATAFALTQTP
jgi:hypothetical protein